MRAFRAFPSFSFGSLHRLPSISGPGGWPLVTGVATAAVLLLLGPGVAAAQQTGAVGGVVRDAQTLEPLEGVQVSIQGTAMGALTNAEGQFTVREVPTGQHTVAAQLIGYGRSTQTVTVEAGARSEVELTLRESAVSMEDIVVTGQAGQARRKEVGNAVGQIDMSEVEEATVNTESLLQGRETGLVIQQSSGSAGAGSFVRLRGNGSVTQGNQPLLYIDGVRVRSEGYPKNVPPVGYSGRSANVQASPLNDIDPNDIERVEIIKGAAATTLYGTEASAGVIQIFTKSGSGDAEWTFGTQHSIDHVLQYGTDEVPYIYMDPWLRDSYGQEYSLSVRGGVADQDVTYYASGHYGFNKEPMPNDQVEPMGVRGNFGWQAAPNLHLQWNTSYNRQLIQQTPSGDNAQGLTLNAWRQATNYVGSTEVSEISKLLDYDIDNQISHLVTGTTFRHAPSDRFSQRLTLGYDRQFQEARQVRPFGFILFPIGRMANRQWTAEMFTVDYSGSYEFRINDNLTNNFSVGGQAISEEVFTTHGFAENFPGPGRPTLSSGSFSLSFEERTEEINAGVFAQNRIGIGDRLFLTAGIRFDGNTAFGEELGLEAYPKFSGSYAISDEDFWPEFLGSTKLRAAYGESGRAPGTFDAVKTWQAVKRGDQPAFLPQNRGNPELGPERSKEIEIGFDATAFDNRVTAEFTWYNSRTVDALFPVLQIPSQGDWGSQAENVGELRIRGVELSLEGTPIRSPDFSWNVGFQVSTNRSEVLDLGKATEFQVGDAAWIVEGQPVPVIRGPKVANPDERADPEWIEDFNYGPAWPEVTLVPSTRVRLPGGVVLRLRGEYQGSYVIEDSNTEGKIIRGQQSWPICIDEWDLINAGNFDQLTAKQRADCTARFGRFDHWVNSGDFFKMREATIQTPIPTAWLTSTIRNARLTLSARNFWKWQEFDFLDPEIGCNTGHTCLTHDQQEHIPPPATYTLGLQFSF